MTDTNPSPLRFALVPAEPTSEMARRGRNALSDNGADNIEVNDAIACYAAMLAASPGNDLMDRIVKELNSAHALALNTGYRKSADRIDAVLNELGGCDG